MIQKDGIVEGLCHIQGEMNPVGVLVEEWYGMFCRRACVCGKRRRAPVMGGNMANGLPGT